MSSPVLLVGACVRRRDSMSVARAVYNFRRGGTQPPAGRHRVTGEFEGVWPRGGVKGGVKDVKDAQHWERKLPKKPWRENINEIFSCFLQRLREND